MSFLSIRDMLNRTDESKCNKEERCTRIDEKQQTEQSDILDKNDATEPNKRRAHFNDVEDKMLRYYVSVYGTNWMAIAKFIPNRTARQCRDRWNNYLNPSISQEPWTVEEEKILLEKYKEYGPQWKIIAGYFKNRSYNCVRNKYCAIQRQINEIGANESSITTK